MMMKYINVCLVLMVTFLGAYGQEVFNFNTIKDKVINLGEVLQNNEEFGYDYKAIDTLLKDVEIVMLGEQSHGEATTYQTKIKLIKYLHQKLGYDLLLFESGFYDCHKALELIKGGGNTRQNLGHSVMPIWSLVKEFKPLSDYIDTMKNTKNSLDILGFDSQFTGKLSEKYFIPDLSQYLNKIDSSIIQSKRWEHLVTNFNHLQSFEKRKLKRNSPELDTLYLDELIIKIEAIPSNFDSRFWAQSLRSFKNHLSNKAFKKEARDKQMAENLIWIKENYPNRKIICWGATNHFLYNSESVTFNNVLLRLYTGKYYKKHALMGNYIKDKYGSKVFTIGFTAHKGHYGLFKKKKLKESKKGSVEWVLNQSKNNNFLLPLKGLNLKGYKSRTLGNFYIKNDVSLMMDAIIFNRTMVEPHKNYNLIYKLYPDHKHIKKTLEKE